MKINVDGKHRAHLSVIFIESLPYQKILLLETAFLTK